MATRAWSLLSILGLSLLPTAAQAGNDDELLLGNQAAILGGAVIATVNDSSATWYNPAGLGQVDRDQFDVSATAYTLRSYSAPKLLSTPSGAYKDGSVTEFVVAPTQIAYVRRLGSGTSLGFGYFVPKASNFVLRENLTDHDGNPPSQWQLAAAGADTQHIGAVALGTNVSPTVRVGGSLIGGYAASTGSASVFGSVSPDGEHPLGSSAVTSVATSSRFSLQIGMGVQWQVRPELTLGATLRTPELQLHASENNNYNLSGTLLTNLNDPRFGAVAREDVRSVGLDVLKAGRGAVSVSYNYGSGWITAEADIQPGLHRERVDVNRKPVFNARLGWYHILSPAVSFGLGLFTDRTPQAEAYSLLDGSGDFYGGTAGVELSNEHMLAPNERASSLTFKSVFALRYAFSSGQFGRILGDPNSIVNEPFKTEKGDIIIHELGLYVGGGLRF